LRVRCSFSELRGVAQSPDDPDAVAAVRGADVASTHHERPAGVARRLQVAEDGIRAATAQSRHVLDEHPAWAEFADDAGELAPEAAAVAREANAPTCGGDILAGEAARDEVDGLKIPCPGEADVAASNNVGPVPREDVLTEWLPLDLPAHREAGALEPERHAPDAREEIAARHALFIAARRCRSAATRHRPLQ
jgi:hypothetical protein